MEEHTAGKKERAKPPKPPVFEELKIICICGNSHDGSYYKVNAHTIARIKCWASSIQLESASFASATVSKPQK
jgi:hypothetical protein